MFPLSCALAGTTCMKTTGRRRTSPNRADVASLDACASAVDARRPRDRQPHVRRGGTAWRPSPRVVALRLPVAALRGSSRSRRRPLTLRRRHPAAGVRRSGRAASPAALCPATSTRSKRSPPSRRRHGSSQPESASKAQPATATASTRA
jgi:hypothetical protein